PGAAATCPGSASASGSRRATSPPATAASPPRRGTPAGWPRPGPSAPSSGSCPPSWRLLRLALPVIGQPDQGLHIGQSPPAIPPNEPPETLRHPAVQALQPRRRRGRTERLAQVLELGHGLRLRVVHHRDERPPVPVVARDQVQEQLAVDG